MDKGEKSMERSFYCSINKNIFIYTEGEDIYEFFSGHRIGVLSPADKQLVKCTICDLYLALRPSYPRDTTVGADYRSIFFQIAPGFFLECTNALTPNEKQYGLKYFYIVADERKAEEKARKQAEDQQRAQLDAQLAQLNAQADKNRRNNAAGSTQPSEKDLEKIRKERKRDAVNKNRKKYLSAKICICVLCCLHAIALMWILSVDALGSRVLLFVAEAIVALFVIFISMGLVDPLFFDVSMETAVVYLILALLAWIGGVYFPFEWICMAGGLLATVFSVYVIRKPAK